MSVDSMKEITTWVREQLSDGRPLLLSDIDRHWGRELGAAWRTRPSDEWEDLTWLTFRTPDRKPTGDGVVIVAGLKQPPAWLLRHSDLRGWRLGVKLHEEFGAPSTSDN